MKKDYANRKTTLCVN